MFYHGYDNYMKHAFPEDEIRPISCTPLTRDRTNPSHIELNDALGNYSLTLIDSLSTLAIMASAPHGRWKKNRALNAFQDGVKDLVEQYGDGTNGTTGLGKRARGFDVDSKVQVFETVIRGVGGLLSAHLFAIGELPITGYTPKWKRRKMFGSDPLALKWANSFAYDGQLLRLAEDLADRLLPAFVTPTGLPYPRVNLRHGVPFYANSPLNNDSENGQCAASPNPAAEITETCSAGAGSLVLEFTILSRLTNKPIYEHLAKLAFWSVWDRRSSIGLVGAGVDAETGRWTSPYTGIGAGIDSFYEYAAKTGILLSGAQPPGDMELPAGYAALAEATKLVSDHHHSADAFDQVWQESHAAIKRHLYRGSQFTHPHYIQGDLFTGASRAYWLDSLSAFYPGLLAMFGEIDEAVDAHLLFTALWTRYSALPERWSVSSGGVESGLGWWGGRPEFIESTYHIYRATQDPWYLHVGEMVLRDIKRRCWVKCGFSGLQDVKTGEQSDRMESFFLGETTKYLFLLFSPDHPLNKLDAPFVFTTEGHPLIIPRGSKKSTPDSQPSSKSADRKEKKNDDSRICPNQPSVIPFSISTTAAKDNIFHAAKLARLHQMPTRDTLESPLVEYSHDHPSITISDIRSPSNFTYYPWTLPLELIPHNGVSARLQSRKTLDVTFPTLSNTITGPNTLQRVVGGLYIHSMSGLRISFVLDIPSNPMIDGLDFHYRIQSVNNVQLGKDERVYLPKTTALAAISASDPNFTFIRDTVHVDLVIDLPPTATQTSSSQTISPTATTITTSDAPANPSLLIDGLDSDPTVSSMKSAISLLLHNIGLLLPSDPPPPSPTSTNSTDPKDPSREYLPAILPIGAGAAPLPDIEDVLAPDIHGTPQGALPYHTIYLGGLGCSPYFRDIPSMYEVLVIKRGHCSFAQKLANIPTHPPRPGSLKMVVVVDDPEIDGATGQPFASGPRQGEQNKDEDERKAGEANGKAKNDSSGETDFDIRALTYPITRPALDSEQRTLHDLPRRNPIPMIMVSGGEGTYRALGRAKGLGLKRKWEVRSQGVGVDNLVIL